MFGFELSMWLKACGKKSVTVWIIGICMKCVFCHLLPVSITAPKLIDGFDLRMVRVPNLSVWQGLDAIRQ